MKDKKHIDQLFKEQLQQFEVTPDPVVWANIQEQLQKKKKDRKVIPIWWKLGGVAASLLLLLTLSIPFFTDSEVIDSQKMGTEDTVEKTHDALEEKKGENSSAKDKDIQTSIAEKDRDDNNETSDDPSKSNVDPITNSSLKNRATENTLAKEDEIIPSNSKEATIKKNIKDPFAPKKNKETKYADVQKPKQDLNTASSEKITTNTATIPNNTTKDAVAVENNTNSNKTLKEKDLPIKKATIVDPTNKNSETPTEDAVAKEDAANKVNEAANKKSIFDAIEENKEDAVAISKERVDKAWEVTPNVGPVYYSSLGQGSSIDPAFSDNTQSGDVNLSYGVQVAYNINDRFSIRSGVNNVNVDYSTGGIDVISGPESFGLSSINYTPSNGRNVLTPVDRGAASQIISSNDVLSQANLKSTSPSAEIIQNISYFEVPLELKYKVLNKKFGINMIGGFSTLFLGDNEVVVTDGSFRNLLGEANNLNNVSFSTNIGLGFDYNLGKSLRFNVEPMFKYQINPYSDTSVDFRPYYLGVYSGITFKF